jgi:Legionella pneumophila major outer membrane protein precursor
MGRMLGLRMMLVLLAGTISAASSYAQTQKSESGPESLTAPPDVLRGLPRPPDAPGSLFQKASATPAYSCEPLPGPLFEEDPLLDPPELPPVGWFASLDLGIIKPHIKNRLTDTVQIDGLGPDTVHLPTAPLEWTVAPRVEIGYRLPSGFGGFALAYRFFGTDGSETLLGPDGPASLRSRLDVNVVDLDYQSWEMSLWPNWEMKWWFGLRQGNVYFDSQEREPFAAAAAGSGIVATRTTNHHLGWGPHYGLELDRHWNESGLSFVTWADGATLLGRTVQRYQEVSAIVGPNGLPLVGETKESNPQTVPVLSFFAGMAWQPPQWHSFRFSVGYEYEYWWNVGRISTARSRGEMSDQGVLLRGEFHF